MNRFAVLFVLFGSPTVSYADGPSTAVVVTGDCQNFDLTRAAGEFTEALKKQPEVQVIELDAALPRIGREASRSVEEVQRQLAVVEDHFYRGQYAKMVERLEVALGEVSRLQPGRARWQLYAAAWNLEALARSRLKKRGSIEDAYRNILRLDTTYKLDPDYVAPSMIKLFEDTRRKLAAEKKHSVSITTSPPGAKVHVDGKELSGKVTPVTLDLPHGIYSVVVEKNGRLSFPRQIDVSAVKEVVVDLKFEGSVEAGRSLCLAIGPDEQQRLNAASRLGSLLDADQVVMLRRDQLKEHPAWLTATAVVGSAKVREGGLEVHATEGIRGGAMEALARFIATGELSGVVRSPPQPQDTAAKTVEVITSPPLPPPVEPVSTPAAPRSGPTRTAGLAALGTGGVVAAVGAGFLVVAANESARLTARRTQGIPDDQAGEVRQQVDSALLKQRIGWVGVGAGAAAAGVGAYLILRPGPASSSPAQVTILPTAEGALLSIHGGFPW